jgi:serine/threonine protein kinase
MSSNHLLPEQRNKQPFLLTSSSFYELGILIGKGAYGEVYESHEVNEGYQVAIKILDKNQYMHVNWKELQILQLLDHPNVIKIIDFSEKKTLLYLIFDWFPLDIGAYLNRTKKGMRTNLAVSYMKQLCSALAHIHDKKIIHRDIKPQNLLIDKTGKLVLIDFGISVFVSSDNTYDLSPNALLYRPLEILLSDKHQYTSAVDMWAVGCIFVELLTGAPLFAGDFQITQIFDIFRLLGTPTGDCELCCYAHFTHKFPKWKRPRRVFPTFPEDIEDFILKCLEYNPAFRITAQESLKHSLFSRNVK